MTELAIHSMNGLAEHPISYTQKHVTSKLVAPAIEPSFQNLYKQTSEVTVIYNQSGRVESVTSVNTHNYWV